MKRPLKGAFNRALKIGAVFDLVQSEGPRVKNDCGTNFTPSNSIFGIIVHHPVEIPVCCINFVVSEEYCTPNWVYSCNIF